MSLNKQSGNMYGFVTHTWNPIKGKCPHRCSYCYMTKMYKRYKKWDETLRLDAKCLKDNLGEGNFIFVGSSTDMFADNIHPHFIQSVINYCCDFSNQYLFQSKNPDKFNEFYGAFPKDSIFATTIESNRTFNGIVDVSVYARVKAMQKLDLKKMVTCEPIMDFDINSLIGIIKMINPFQVNIGADSGHNNLPEPPKEKIRELIIELKKFTTVHLKDNLKRLL